MPEKYTSDTEAEIKLEATYITGFLHDNKNRFLMVRKTRGPSTVIGKLTGVGGKVEQHDFFHSEAMAREVREEMGEEFEFEWHTVGLIEYEGLFMNIIFHAKVDDLNALNLPSRNDVDEKFEVHHVNDILCHEECGLGVKSVIALIAYEDIQTDRIEVTRYLTNERQR